MFHGLMDMFDLPDGMLSGAAQELGDVFDSAMDRAFETTPEELELQPARQEEAGMEDLFPIAAVTGASALGYGYLASEEAERKRQAEQQALDFLYEDI